MRQEKQTSEQFTTLLSIEIWVILKYLRKLCLDVRKNFTQFKINKLENNILRRQNDHATNYYANSKIIGKTNHKTWAQKAQNSSKLMITQRSIDDD